MSPTDKLRARFRRWAPIARRDEQIAKLNTQVKKAGRERDRLDRERRRIADRARDEAYDTPSFQAHVRHARRLSALSRDLGGTPTSIVSLGKAYVQQLVASHGIAVPRVLGSWETPASIDWASLPDLVVVKGTRGTASRGVYPLRRSGESWELLTHPGTVTSGELVDRLEQLERAGDVAGPFVGEEFLGSQSGELPLDVKIYVFYGETAMVMLRRAGSHGDPQHNRFRLLDPDGQDLHHSYHGRPTDTTIPVPELLPELIRTAEQISLLIRTPFARIDLYERDQRVVFGEITPRPGGDQWFGAELDRSFGERWEMAEFRLWNDRAAGMGALPEMGESDQPAD